MKMQRAYLDVEEVKVPHFLGRYVVRQSDFTVTDTETSSPVPVESRNNKLFVTLRNSKLNVTVELPILVAISFKCSSLPVDKWGLLEIDYYDQDPTNFHPGNTVLVFPDGGIEHQTLEGMYYIPGFTRYLISKDGRVLDHKRNVWIKVDTYTDYPSTSSMKGYNYMGVERDTGKRSTLGLHRALALAFKKFDARVDSLDVNHKNGIKGDDWVDNLEWASRMLNNLHAVEIGLKDDNHPVVIKSVFTGEEREFFSLWECARSLGVHGELIRYRLQYDGQRAFQPGLLFKRKDSQTPWPNLKIEDKRSIVKGFPLREFRLKPVDGSKTIVLRHRRAVTEYIKTHPETSYNLEVVVLDSEEVCKSLFAEKQRSYLT